MTQAVQAMVGTVVNSIVAVGALTHELLHSLCNLEATQMNMQQSLIEEF